MSSATLKKLQGFIAVGTEAPFMDPDGLVIVGIDELETPENWYAHCVRVHDETDAMLKPYVDDIWRAIEVNKAGSPDNVVQGCKDGDRIIVLDGRRTARAARLVRSQQGVDGVPALERIKVRVVIHAGKPDDWYRINDSSHKSKPLTKLQEAASFLALFNRFAEDHKRVASLKGCTVQTVKNQLAVSQASERVQGLYEEGKFPIREIVNIVALPRDEQDKTIAALEAAGNGTSGAAARNAVREVRDARAASPGKAVKPSEVVTGDKTKMRSRVFLEKWVKALKKVDTVHLNEINPIALLKFVLGGAVPRGIDEQVKESLTEAGWKK